MSGDRIKRCKSIIPEENEFLKMPQSLEFLELLKFGRGKKTLSVHIC